MLYLTNDKARIDAAIDEAHAVLKAAGFNYKRSTQSALETRLYVCTRTARSVEVSGWHGTGKWSDGRTVHGVYFTHNGEVINHPKGAFISRGDETKVIMSDELDDYSFAGNRTVWGSEQARNDILAKIEALPNDIRNWLTKTA